MWRLPYWRWRTHTSESPKQVVDVVLRATQRRLTTPARLGQALQERTRQRWRSLIGDVLADVEAGVASPLERRYARDVEGAHGLPRGLRNAPEADCDGTRYRDVRYGAWRLVVELDGREAHPTEEAFRDRRRDNRAVSEGDAVLRYGWREVVGDFHRLGRRGQGQGSELTAAVGFPRSRAG